MKLVSLVHLLHACGTVHMHLRFWIFSDFDGLRKHTWNRSHDSGQNFFRLLFSLLKKHFLSIHDFFNFCFFTYFSYGFNELRYIWMLSYLLVKFLNYTNTNTMIKNSIISSDLISKFLHKTVFKFSS